MSELASKIVVRKCMLAGKAAQQTQEVRYTSLVRCTKL